MQTPAMAMPWLILPLALAAAWPAAGWAQALPAVVLSIGDGDTIRVRQDGRAITIRLACIDAPETAQAPWGHQARRHLQQRLPIGRTVALDVKTSDRYGRLVAEVIADVNIGQRMVEDGQAFAYRRYLSGCDASDYLDAESRARRRRHGVWQVEGGITRPWDFRRNRRVALPPDGAGAGGRRYRCWEISSHARAQELLRQGQRHLDGDGDGEACESLR